MLRTDLEVVGHLKCSKCCSCFRAPYVFALRTDTLSKLECREAISDLASAASRDIWVAGMPKDRQWLKQRLCSTLGWDEVVVDGVIEAIATAESAEEADAIVQVCFFRECDCGRNSRCHL